ncbi:MAG: molybdenum cofactor biosynthesis protein MoaE [Gemmatimonadota bacterium]
MPHLTHAAIDAAALAHRVQSPARGAAVSFLGLVRDHHGGRTVERLDYSAYEPMAETECARIVSEAESRWPVAIALEHRLGRLTIGDVAVAVVAAAPHRAVAFEACRFVIDEVKARVPIWKREHYSDGTVGWVDPTAAGGVVADRPDPP